MQYIKSVNFKTLITNMIESTRDTERSDHDSSRNKSDKSPSKKVNKPSKIFQTANQETLQMTPSIESALQFASSIIERSNQQTIEQRRRSKPKLKSYLMDLTIEPIYVHSSNPLNLLRFEFQLGSEGFLERIQALYEELHFIQNAIENIANRQLLESFQIFQGYQQKIQHLCFETTETRNSLKKAMIFLDNRIEQKTRKRLLLKKKLGYLRSLKKNRQDICYFQCQNLEQVFYSQKARNSQYKKVSLSEVAASKVHCLGKSKEKLVKSTTNNLEIIRKSVQKWIQSDLSEKQIEKLLILLHFIKTEPIYRQNGLSFDIRSCALTSDHATALHNGLTKVKQWKTYRYLSDSRSQQKVHIFLNELIKEMIQI